MNVLCFAIFLALISASSALANEAQHAASLPKASPGPNTGPTINKSAIADQVKKELVRLEYQKWCLETKVIPSERIPSCETSKEQIVADLAHRIETLRIQEGCSEKSLQLSDFMECYRTSLNKKK